MTRQELAEMLNGRQYRNELNKEEHIAAKDSGLVVIFGASDDLMEFRGAIYDEAECYDGGDVIFTKDGKFPEAEEIDTLRKYASDDIFNKIEAIWCPAIEGNPSWAYETNIPHDTFKIYDDEDLYCIGIVFYVSDLN